MRRAIYDRDLGRRVRPRVPAPPPLSPEEEARHRATPRRCRWCGTRVPVWRRGDTCSANCDRDLLGEC